MLCVLLADTKIWQTKIEKAEGEEDEGEPEYEPFPDGEFGPEGRLADHWTWARVDIPDTFGKVEKVSAGENLSCISRVHFGVRLDQMPGAMAVGETAALGCECPSGAQNAVAINLHADGIQNGGKEVLNNRIGSQSFHSNSGLLACVANQIPSHLPQI